MDYAANVRLLMPLTVADSSGFSGLTRALPVINRHNAKILGRLQGQKPLDKAIDMSLYIFTYRSQGGSPPCPDRPRPPRPTPSDGTVASTLTPRRCATRCSCRRRSSIPAISCRSSTRCCVGSARTAPRSARARRGSGGPGPPGIRRNAPTRPAGCRRWSPPSRGRDEPASSATRWSRR